MCPREIAGSVFGYRCKWNNLAMPVTTICTPTQKVKKATILLMTMLPLVPIFRMMPVSYTHLTLPTIYSV